MCLFYLFCFVSANMVLIRKSAPMYTNKVIFWYVGNFVKLVRLEEVVFLISQQLFE